jgi:hypothetical protein
MESTDQLSLNSMYLLSVELITIKTIDRNGNRFQLKLETKQNGFQYNNKIGILLLQTIN